MELTVNVESGKISENIDLCALYDNEALYEAQVKDSIMENIDSIISGDLSKVPKSILISDSKSIDRIVSFIGLLDRGK